MLYVTEGRFDGKKTVVTEGPPTLAFGEIALLGSLCRSQTAVRPHADTAPPVFSFAGLESTRDKPCGKAATETDRGLLHEAIRELDKGEAGHQKQHGMDGGIAQMKVRLMRGEPRCRMYDDQPGNHEQWKMENVESVASASEVKQEAVEALSESEQVAVQCGQSDYQ